MADWPPTSGGRVAAVGADTANSGGTTVTASGTANTKGAWEELSASTPFECDSLLLHMNFAAASYLLDIGVGAAGSETILIPDIHSSTILGNVPAAISVPVRVPAGVRLAARAASTAASATITMTGYLVKGGFDRPVGRSCVKTYGADSADSGGTSVDPGATANTKGAWAEITASTTAATKELIIAVGNQNNPTATAANFLADIGVGAAGSETILIPDIRLLASTSETIEPRFSPPFPVSIPQDSRLAVRTQSSTTNATDRLLDFVLYGVT